MQDAASSPPPNRRLPKPTSPTFNQGGKGKKNTNKLHQTRKTKNTHKNKELELLIVLQNWENNSIH